MTLFYCVVDLRFGNAALQWQLTRIALEADYGRRNAAHGRRNAAHCL